MANRLSKRDISTEPQPAAFPFSLISNHAKRRAPVSRGERDDSPLLPPPQGSQEEAKQIALVVGLPGSFGGSITREE